MKLVPWFLIAPLLGSLLSTDSVWGDSGFKRVVLSESFHSEGADAADFNGDGVTDVVSGPFWYAGPEFRRRYEYAPVKRHHIKGYSDHFFSFARDVDLDGRIDIVSVPIPGSAAVWYRNPGGAEVEKPWRSFPVLGSVDNESPTMADLDDDGRDELVCIHDGRYGYAQPDEDDATREWEFVPVSENRGYGRFTHGLGVGDVDGDGRTDLLEKDGWWQQGPLSEKPFRFHAVPFSAAGGSQMFAYDFDGDGDNDVLSVQQAHGYGLCWFERRGTGDEISFLRHVITDDSPSGNPFGVSLSQMHAVALADIDGDGVKDIITGKRFYAHGGNDPGAAQLPVLLWFRTSRSRLGLQFVPHLIDRRVGVGTQLTAKDLDNDGRIDLVVGNKLGTALLFNQGGTEQPLRPEEIAAMSAGSDEFKTAIRSTDPLTPEQERAGFVVPEGFEVQLVASEPDIAKPMNMAFDRQGRLWVSSSVEYPFPAEQGKGRDTIKILEDTNGDGRADQIQTFADGLNIPMGLYPYGDGVICYSIPNIWYLRDTDGDGRCDRRDILYGPFDYSRDTHGMCNGFTRGFDGWLYACHGFNNQSSVAGNDGNRVEMKSGNTFRMRLDGSRIEHFTHGQVNPFGMAINPSGELMTADCHTKPVSLLLRGGYYQSFGAPHDGIGFVPDVMDHLHGSTAIGGIALYHGQSFPAVYQGNAFGGNVMTSRINRNSVERQGGSIRVFEEPDFLISGDPWFRPVDLQVGPDGALYVADFYNRIIGHYEVGLDHPGRDRRRGRIWRIVFSDDSGRRDVLGASPPKLNLPVGPFSAAIARLNSGNLTERLLATDELSDVAADQRKAVESAVRQALTLDPGAAARVHLLWVLKRIEGLDERDLADACRNDDPLVRAHGFQMLADGIPIDQAEELLLAGLRDSDGRVQRAAAAAADSRFSVPVGLEMLKTLRRVGSRDPHLAHALKLSLRDQLRTADSFASLAAALPQEETETLVDLCLGVKTEFAGQYVAEHLAGVNGVSQEKLSEYLSFATQYASPGSLPGLIKLIESRFAGDLSYQERLARSVRDGLKSRGLDLTEEVRSWSQRITREYLGMKPGDVLAPAPEPSITWTYHPDPGQADQPNPFVVSTRRKSQDGESNTPLHSSFPTGETRVGLYRSDDFTLPESFGFFLAGHDGVPGKPLQNQNYVQVCDAKTREVLKRFSPPRNDTAQPMLWSTGEDAGRRVHVELVDGDRGGAYAWLAAGRFSVAGLNPSGQSGRLQKGADMVRDFNLPELVPALSSLLESGDVGRSNRHALAVAIASLSGGASRKSLADAISFSAVTGPLLEEVVDAVRSGSEPDVADVMTRVMKVASSSEQQRLAGILATDRSGVGLLVELVSSGASSPRLLLDPGLKDRMDKLLTPDQEKRVNEWVRDLPAEEDRMAGVMAQRKRHYAENGGDSTAGEALFAKHCSVCHQIAGKGNVVGPNLDGIGNRGLDRLTEDVLMPNQNVDAAFRASVVLTDDGRVISGLLKPVGDRQWRMVDLAGKATLLHEDEIVRRDSVRTSPMPANFHQTLSDQQTTDLFRYLLSLTH